MPTYGAPALLAESAGRYVPTAPGPHPAKKRSLETDSDVPGHQDPSVDEGRVAPSDLAELLMEPVFKGPVGLEIGDETRPAVKRQTSALYKGFALPRYVLQAFQKLTVNVDIVSEVHIGDFVTELTYSQAGVPARFSTIC